MADDKSLEDRTEDATPQHREQAREKGHLPRSRDLVGAATLSHALFGHIDFALTGSLLIGSLPGVYLGAPFFMDEIRPGIGLYGGGPAPGKGDAPQLVVTLFAPVLQLREIAPGETIGYGASFTAGQRHTLATVGIGYADGFLRAASNRGYGVIRGARRPILGRVSMDLIVLDVTGVGAVVGDEVELMGANLPLRDQAAAMGTVDYELLTRLGQRIERTYVGGI